MISDRMESWGEKTSCFRIVTKHFGVIKSSQNRVNRKSGLLALMLMIFIFNGHNNLYLQKNSDTPTAFLGRVCVFPRICPDRAS